MRRSSCFALASACALLVILSVMMFVSTDRRASTMDRRGAEAFLASGERMLSAGDVDGIMGLFRPDGKALGVEPEKLRPAVASAIHDMEGRSLTAVAHNLSVKPEGDTAYLTFDLDLDEKQKAANIHYFTSHVNLTLKKTSTAHLLGLYNATEWKISQLDADPPFGFLEL